MVLLRCPWRNLSLIDSCEQRTLSSSEEKVSTKLLNLCSAAGVTAGSNFPNLWACDFSHSDSMQSLSDLSAGLVAAVGCLWTSQLVKSCWRLVDMAHAWWTCRWRKSSGFQPVRLCSAWNWCTRSPKASDLVPLPKAIWKAKLTSSLVRSRRIVSWVLASEWNSWIWPLCCLTSKKSNEPLAEGSGTDSSITSLKLLIPFPTILARSECAAMMQGQGRKDLVRSKKKRPLSGLRSLPDFLRISSSNEARARDRISMKVASGTRSRCLTSFIWSSSSGRSGIHGTLMPCHRFSSEASGSLTPSGTVDCLALTVSKAVKGLLEGNAPLEAAWGRIVCTWIFLLIATSWAKLAPSPAKSGYACWASSQESSAHKVRPSSAARFWRTLSGPKPKACTVPLSVVWCWMYNAHSDQLANDGCKSSRNRCKGMMSWNGHSLPTSLQDGRFSTCCAKRAMWEVFLFGFSRATTRIPRMLPGTNAR